jgi:hypothetical protein
MEFEVKKIGFGDGENTIIPIICLRKADRVELGTDLKKPVKVRIRNGEVEAVAIALVQLQFRDFVGEQASCSVNTKLAEMLSLTQGSKVEISNDVTESEYEAFNQAAKEASRAEFQRIFGGLVGRG